MLRHRTSDRTAAVAVEFAVIAPVFILLIFMMIEGSRFLQATDAVQGAAREASRAAAIFGHESPICSELALTFLEHSALDTTTANIAFETESSTVDGYEVVKCTVEIDYSDVSLIGDPFSLAVSKVTGRSAILAETDLGQ